MLTKGEHTLGPLKSYYTHLQCSWCIKICEINKKANKTSCSATPVYHLPSPFPSLLGAYFKESLEAAHWKSSKLRYNWLDLAEEYIAWQRQRRCAEALIYDFTWNSIRILQKTETEKENFLRLLRCFESFPGEFVEREVDGGGESCKHKYVT